MSDFEKVMPRLAQDGFEKEQTICITWIEKENEEVDCALMLNCTSHSAIEVIANHIQSQSKLGLIIIQAILNCSL